MGDDLLGHGGGGLPHVLAAVEDQQPTLVPQPGQHGSQGVALPGQGHAGAGGERLRDGVLPIERAELEEPDGR